MSFLLCTFASPRCPPEKIRRWIEYLEAQRAKHRNDEFAVQTIEQLLQEARTWTQ